MDSTLAQTYDIMKSGIAWLCGVLQYLGLIEFEGPGIILGLGMVIVPGMITSLLLIIPLIIVVFFIKDTVLHKRIVRSVLVTLSVGVVFDIAYTWLGSVVHP